MDYGRIARLSLLMFALAGTAQAADKATLADAAEQRNQASSATFSRQAPTSMQRRSMG